MVIASGMVRNVKLCLLFVIFNEDSFINKTALENNDCIESKLMSTGIEVEKVQHNEHYVEEGASSKHQH